MRWTAAALLRPITFVLAIVAAVLVGNRTDSFWYGLLTWFIAMGVGRVDRRARARAARPGDLQGDLAGRGDRLRVPLRLARAAAVGEFFVAFIAASLTKGALRGVVPNQRRVFTVPTSGGWRRAVDLDELLP